MDFNSVEKAVMELGLGEDLDLYETEGGLNVFVKRPSDVVRGLRHEYEKELNFQIFLKKPGEDAFRPNHLRVLIDFHLKKESRKELFSDLLSSVEQIYEGSDPEVLLEKFESYNFPMQIDPLDVTFYLTQLFMVEQQITWGERAERESRYEPPYLFFMGYIRMVFDDAKEIDKLCWGAANRNPPLVGYTKLDNKEREEYTEEKDKLWYLTDKSNV